MTSMRYGTPLLTTLMLSACVSGPTVHGPTRQVATTIARDTGVEIRVSENGSIAERTIQLDADAAWRVLPQVYQELGLGGAVLDAEERTFANPQVTARTIGRSRTTSLFRCANEGTGASSAGQLRIQFSISTTVSAAADGETQLRTDIVATGRPLEGTSTGPLLCISRGILEAAIEERILAAAGG